VSRAACVLMSRGHGFSLGARLAAACADPNPPGAPRRVLEGMSVLQKMSQLPTTRANTDSPFFKTAKTIGDSRATVAEKGFGRPLGIKVTVKASNLLSADN
jgi:hypothetical protein